jgi:hypothetical protein
MTSFLRPVNRHLLVVPHFKSEKPNENGILLPEDYKPQENRYITATVVDVAQDCAEPFQRLRRGTFSEKAIVLDKSMLEEVDVKGKVSYIILENYVVGLLRGIDED